MATIYDLFQINPDEAEAIGYASKLSPAEGLMADRRMFEQRAVRGIEDLGRTAMGLPQSPRADRQAAATELTALAQKVRPGTAEFYEAAIPILQKYNMPAEAADMEAKRLALDTAKTAQSPLLKLQQDKDQLLKRPDASSPNVQAAIAAIDRKIAEFGTRPDVDSKDPEFIKLLNAYEAAVTAGQGDRAGLIKQALAAWIKNKESSGQDVAWARLALAQLVEDRQRGKEDRKVTLEDEAIVASVQGAVRLLDEEVRAATALLTHAGTAGITGARYGAVPLGVLAAGGGNTADAAAFYRSIEGQVFIRALQDLKATSKTGASGLGQLTEVEGGKIQQARAQIHRQQTTEQFLQNLRHYIASLQSGRREAEKVLATRNATVPSAPAPHNPTAGRADPRAVTPPAARTFKSTPVK